MKSLRLAVLKTALVVVLFGMILPVTAQSGDRIKLATTTSTENSGLLDVLLPRFQEKTKIRVDVIAVGTGAAIKLGKNGDADVVLVHDPHMEAEFVASGFGIARRDVMYNDFVVLGPPSDPAGIGAVKSTAEAFRKIAASGADFISRGDNSGTHVKELAIWKAAGIKPSGRWYKEAGQGMGAVITMAAGLGGYTLADRGTYISMEDKVSVKILNQGDPDLFNPYGIIAVNPARHPHVNNPGAIKLIDWITGEEGQRMIADFKLNNKQLFYPNAKK
jgi:tungstate transport system substrate-binding protein